MLYSYSDLYRLRGAIQLSRPYLRYIRIFALERLLLLGFEA